MRKKLNSKFEIKPDFKRKTENPSRLFHSFADMIEGISRLDHLIAQSVNTKIQSNLVLDDIEKGSLIGRLWNALIISEDGQIDNSPEENEIEEYIEESRAEALDFIAQKKNSIDDLEELKETISQIAEEKKLNDSFNYADLDVLKLAEGINKINNSTKDLVGDESYELKSGKRKVENIRSGTPMIDLEAVEDALTENEIVNEAEFFYLIRKPDFLGESAWSFKHGNKPVSVKILDEDWLSDFHSGSIVVVPGDSLQVLVRQTSKYNRNGELISDKLEVIKVLKVIHNS